MGAPIPPMGYLPPDPPMSYNRAGELNACWRRVAEHATRPALPRDRNSWFNNLGSALLMILVMAAIALGCLTCHAHELKPGECVSYANDALRFMAVKAEGYSVDNASEGLRQMFQDQGWFTYVRDKQDVDRMRGLVAKIWELPGDVNPVEFRATVLQECDPDNDEQFYWYRPGPRGCAMPYAPNKNVPNFAIFNGGAAGTMVSPGQYTLDWLRALGGNASSPDGFSLKITMPFQPDGTPAPMPDDLAAKLVVYRNSVLAALNGIVYPPNSNLPPPWINPNSSYWP